MRLTGLKTAMLAVGLMLAGASQAAPQAAPAPAAPVAAPTAAATPTTPTAVPKAGAPAPAAAATPAADPAMTAVDGGPYVPIDPKIGQPTPDGWQLQPQVTKNGQFAAWMHDAILFPVIVAISIFVLFLLLWVAARFNRRANPVPSKTAHNTMLEVAWTLIPVVILVIIAVPSIKLLANQYKPAPKGAITLKATGNQWYWTYTYPENGDFEITSNLLRDKSDLGDGGPPLAAGERWRTEADGPRLLAVDNRVVLPVGVPIRLITTSADVIHSWTIPAFWIKLDAVPGRLNETSFTIDKPGVYFGQCSELCGPKHGYMPISVVAVPLDVYNRWVIAKGGHIAGTPDPAKVAADAAAAGAAGNTSAGNELAPADSMIENDSAAGGNATGQ